MIKLIPIIVLVFTNSYDAGSAARPLYYSNRIESYCFPFGVLIGDLLFSPGIIYPSIPPFDSLPIPTVANPSNIASILAKLKVDSYIPVSAEKMVSGIVGTTRFPQCTDLGNYIMIDLDDRWHCVVSPTVLTLDIRILK